MPQPAPFLVLQSAALPFRFTSEQGQIEVLLITSTRTNRWIIPKGHMEPFMTPQQSAEIEAYEEAGIYGEIQISPIGSWNYTKRGALYRVMVYPLLVDRVVPSWPEMHERQRQWFSLRHAVKRVDEADLKPLIDALPEFIRCHRVELSEGVV